MRRFRRATERAALALCIVLLAAASGRPQQAQPPSAPFPLLELSIADLQQRMADGRETSRSIVASYIARIEALDRRGPELRSVLEINPDALAIANGWTPNASAGASAARCTASRSCSRTTSPPAIGC